MIHDADVFVALRFLPYRKQKEIRGLLNIYKEADQKLNKFKRLTDLHCLTGCGECCLKTSVSCSILEMQPLAAFLWKKGELDSWLSRININDEQATCVFYSPNALDDSWHCQIYPLRPLICRFFGFCSRENKARKSELMLCWRIKDALKQESPETARKLFVKGLYAPVLFNYFMKTYAISPDLANQCMNVNLAFAKATQIIGYYGELTEYFLSKGGEKMANKNFPKKSAQQKPPAKPQPAQQQKGQTQPQVKPTSPNCCCG